VLAPTSRERSPQAATLNQKRPERGRPAPVGALFHQHPVVPGFQVERNEGIELHGLAGKGVAPFAGERGIEEIGLDRLGDYTKGKFYVLTIPDNVIDLYNLPVEVLSRIKEILMPNMPALLEAPGYTSMFVYDNNTLIVESFKNEKQQVKLRLSQDFTKGTDILTGKEMPSEKRDFFQGWRKPPISRTILNLELKPHSYTVIKLEK
jgi:hypothetical protein